MRVNIVNIDKWEAHLTLITLRLAFTEFGNGVTVAELIVLPRGLTVSAYHLCQIDVNEAG